MSNRSIGENFCETHARGERNVAKQRENIKATAQCIITIDKCNDGLTVAIVDNGVSYAKNCNDLAEAEEFIIEEIGFVLDDWRKAERF